MTIVNTKQGKLKGIEANTKDGKAYYKFSGIPFAEPPIGKLRFKDPIPLAPWEGIRDATKEGNKALQMDHITKAYFGDEDCLNLNIYSPNLIVQDQEHLPVMVNIHSGADDSDIDAFIKNDVILVKLNYRVGVLGFLYTDPVNTKGDMGLKDQKLALKWIQQNIKFFGGDPNNVTIFGISSDSSFVECHVISSKSEGLFHKAIMQSGCMLGQIILAKDAVNCAVRLAEKFGYDPEESSDLYDFIIHVDAKELIKASSALINEDRKCNSILSSFVPVYNKYCYDTFIDEDPMKILRSGKFNKVSILSGVSQYEGMALDNFYETQCLNELKEGKFVNNLFPYLRVSKHYNKKFKTVYLKSNPDETNCDSVHSFIDDLTFTAGMLYSINQRIKYNPNPEYFYILTNLRTQFDGKTNPSHNLIIKEQLMKMWTDFAKTGNPTPNVTGVITEIWQSVDKNEFRYLEIGENTTMKKDIFSERRKLWIEVFNYYYKWEV